MKRNIVLDLIHTYKTNDKVLDALGLDRPTIEILLKGESYLNKKENTMETYKLNQIVYTANDTTVQCRKSLRRSGSQYTYQLIEVDEKGDKNILYVANNLNEILKVMATYVNDFTELAI